MKGEDSWGESSEKRGGKHEQRQIADGYPEGVVGGPAGGAMAS